MAIGFDGRVVVITGACGSLGRHYARAFADRGAKLVLNDLGTALGGGEGEEGLAERLAATLRAEGAEAIANHHDIADPHAAAAIIDEAVAAFGRVDVIINNAGIMRNRAFRKMSEEDFRTVIDVHLTGTAWLCRAAFARMEAQGYGRIVMTTSAGGLYGAFGVANYGAAKAALVGLMKVLAIEGARSHILVNAVAPVAESRMMDGLLAEGDTTDLSPEWVVPAVLYLASDQCEASGRILVAAGGHYAGIEVCESRGIYLDQGYPSPEELAARLPEILDMSAARPLPDLAAAIEKATGSSVVTPARAKPAPGSEDS
jgi:NAD(P)-dependent dehydrogenase (short-subunit alcohol dehydrogenase family)